MLELAQFRHYSLPCWLLMWLSRVLTRSWEAVSQSQQLFLTGRLSVCPFLGAKSPLRRESLRSSFQSKPIYRVPATAKSSTKTHSPGLCFLPWRILNSLHQWENKPMGQFSLPWSGMWLLSKVMLGPFTSVPHPLQILTLMGIEKGATLAQAQSYTSLWKYSSFYLFAAAATIYGVEGRLHLLVNCH